MVVARVKMLARDPVVLQAAALWVLLFIIYSLGACRTIYVGDSGELVTAVHLLGIPHPTGFPLYVMLGKLWTLAVPVGSIAFRMSLFSAFTAALTCAVVFVSARRMNTHPAAAWLAAGLLAFAPSFWAQANIQRIYALGALFVALTTAVAFAWHARRNDKLLVLAFFLCGLGATNHSFMGVYAVALGVFVLVTAPRLVFKVRNLVQWGAAILVGLLPYAYLPISSLRNPRLDWGNPETLEGFLTVVSRRHYFGRGYLQNAADFVPIAADFLWSCGVELFWVGSLLALVGAFVGLRSHRALLPLLVIGMNFVAMALHGSRTDIFIWHRYYIPAYVMTALLATMGLDALARRLPYRLAWASVLIPIVACVWGWGDFDRSRFTIAEEYSRTIFKILPPDSTLFARDDNILFPLMYLHMVEGLRPDVKLMFPGLGGVSAERPALNPDTDPIFFTYEAKWRVPGLVFTPRGILYQAWRSGTEPPPILQEELTIKGELDPTVPKDHMAQNLLGFGRYMMGLTYESSDWVRARREFDRVARNAHGNDGLFYNLGIIYRRNGLYEEALRAFERSAQINPRHIAGSPNAQASKKVESTQTELSRVQAVEARLSQSLSLAAYSPGSAGYHQQMSNLLSEMNETRRAKGHHLRSLEILSALETHPER